jgi:hypothetical protein
MADIYRVGVAISMTNGVSGVLGIIQRDILGLNKAINLTQGGLNRLKLAVIGAGAAFAGAAILKGFAGLAEAGGKLLNQQQLMLANGTTHRDLAVETATAYRMMSIQGSNLVQNLKMVADLRTIFGANNLPEATALAPAMMRAGLAAGFMTHKDPEQEAYNIALIEDRLGYTVNPRTGQMDSARAEHMANMIDAIISGTNGRVGTQGLLGFAQQALASGKLLSDQGLIDMVPIIQAMGGQKAGTALTAFDKAFVGGVMTQRGSGWLERLGLLNRSDVKKGESGYSQIAPGSIAGSKLMAVDPQAWANEYLLPSLRKLVGPTGSVQDMLKVIMQSGLANTTVRLLSEMVGSSVQNGKDVKNIQQAAGTSQYDAEMKSLTGATQNFTAAFESLREALGLPAAKMAVSVLNALAGGIRTFVQWVGAHPAYAETMDAMLLGLGTSLAALGVVMTGAAIVGLVGTGGILASLEIGFAGMAAVLSATNWKTVSTDFEAGMTSVEHSIQRMLYDVTHPSQLLKDLLPPAPRAHEHYGITRDALGRGTPGWLPDVGYILKDGVAVPAPPAPRGGAMGPGLGQRLSDDTHAALSAIASWINAGAPTKVTNPQQIGNSVKTGLAGSINAPQSGPSGFNGRVSPFGTPAVATP